MQRTPLRAAADAERWPHIWIEVTVLASQPGVLRIANLLIALHRAQVEHVITGSVAAMAYGVNLVPGDLDIAPALETSNLTRLAYMLRELRAKPKYDPAWPGGPTLQQCEDWIPDPADVGTLDHRLSTPYGELDVVPRKAGAFAELAPRAVPVIAFDVPVLIAHVGDLILLCQQWDRETDRRRLPQLLAARSQLDGGVPPHDVTERLTR